VALPTGSGVRFAHLKNAWRQRVSEAHHPRPGLPKTHPDRIVEHAGGRGKICSARRFAPAQPGGLEAISRRSAQRHRRTAEQTEVLTPAGAQRSAGCDPFRVGDTRGGSPSPDALRDPGLMADIPPGCSTAPPKARRNVLQRSSAEQEHDKNSRRPAASSWQAALGPSPRTDRRLVRGEGRNRTTSGPLTPPAAACIWCGAGGASVRLAVGRGILRRAAARAGCRATCAGPCPRLPGRSRRSGRGGRRWW